MEWMEDNVHEGACFCGAVTFRVCGAPEAMGYCHCRSCRSWSAAPLNAFSLWKPNALQVSKEGSEFVAGFNKTGRSLRQWCTECDGHLWTEHPEMGLVDVYAASIPSLKFKPTVHVFYEEKVLPVLVDFPSKRTCQRRWEEVEFLFPRNKRCVFVIHVCVCSWSSLFRWCFLCSVLCCVCLYVSVCRCALCSTQRRSEEKRIAKKNNKT